MKVIHLIKTGVGAAWALRQIQVLISHGVDVVVILDQDGPMRAQYVSAGAEVHILRIDISSISLADMPVAVRRFRDFVIDEQPDLLHSHFVGTTLFMRMALIGFKKIPRLFQVPGPLHLEKILPRLVDIVSASRHDYWIASCNKTKEMYRSFGVGLNKLYLSYYGTDVESFARHEDLDSLRQELQISKKSKVIGMVAFMYPPRRWLGQRTGLKGHEDLIDAVKILVDEGNDVVVVFVGGAWGDSSWYERRVREYGNNVLGNRSIFLGNRSDVARVYSIFDVAVHPSHSENVGGAVESLLLRVPTVATNIGGFPDLIVDGETGYLAESHNPYSLARGIARSLNSVDENVALIENGYNKCYKLFDMRRTGLEVYHIYKDIISRYNWPKFY